MIIIVIMFKFLHSYPLNSSPLVLLSYADSQFSLDLIFLASSRNSPHSRGSRTSFVSGFLVTFPYAKQDLNMKILSWELHS